MRVSCEQASSHLLTVSLDDSSFKTIHSSIFGKKPNLPQEVSSEEELLEVLARLELQGARQYTLRKLAAQSLHSQKLRKLLQERRVEVTIIDQLVAEFQTQGYLNDEEWVDGFIRGQQRKKVGPDMIRIKLLQRGVHAEIPETDQSDQINALLEGKYRNRDLNDYKERQKVIASLQRKGYSIEAILQVIRNYGIIKVIEDNE